MAHEARAKGTHVILGPTINMQRSPLGGRGFESLSEDPVLAGLGAAALVNGIQDNDIVATIKHFVCNDQEHERNGTDAILTDRALREIYCLPFQLVIRDSKPGCFMVCHFFCIPFSTPLNSTSFLHVNNQHLQVLPQCSAFERSDQTDLRVRLLTIKSMVST
jgi:hypothetical protein